MGGLDKTVYLIEILNWEKYNPKSKPGMPNFMLSKRIMEDVKVQQMTCAEFKIMIGLFAARAEVDTRSIHVSTHVMTRWIQGRPKVVTRSIQALQQLQILRAEKIDLFNKENVKVIRQNQKLTSSVDPTPTLVQEFKNLWNENCGTLPKVRDLTSGRIIKIRKRLAECSDLKIWKEVVARLAASSFCNGKGKKKWVATFDFLIQPDTRIKTLEGAYDDLAESTKTFSPIVAE